MLYKGIEPYETVDRIAYLREQLEKRDEEILRLRGIIEGVKELISEYQEEA